MKTGLPRRIYNRLNRVLIPYKYQRRNAVYGAAQRHIRDTEFLSEKELDVYHLNRIKKIVEYCRMNVPYYRDLFTKLRLDESKIKKLDDIRRIPVLRKKDLKENLNSLVTLDSSFNEKMVYSTTGGTTGEPVGFFSFKNRLQSIENAFVDNIWEQAGYKPGDCIAVLRGTYIEKPAKDGFHWRKYQGDPHLYLSIFHMQEEAAAYYSLLMRRYNVKFIHCFPSSAKTFYKLLCASGAKKPRLKGIFTSSEMLSQSDREFIEEASGTKILDLYGASERVAIAGECRLCGQYHAYPQYGYFELIDDAGNPVTKEGDAGTVIGTSYNRLATPLLRYDLGDMAEAMKTKGTCNRQYLSLSRILGRRVDYALSSTGREISMSMMNMHSKEFDSIIRFQFVQAEPGKIEFHYIPAMHIEEARFKAIENFVRAKLGDGFELRMVAMDDIPRSKNGKHKLIVHLT